MSTNTPTTTEKIVETQPESTETTQIDRSTSDTSTGVSSASTTTAPANDRKKLIIGLVLIGFGLLVAVGITFAVVTALKSDEPEVVEEPAKKKVVEEINVIPVSERPVVYVIPEADGRNVQLSVDELKKSATEVEYELEYQAGSLLQGVFGNLALDQLPVTKKMLLGSCSAGGACTYHTDVKGGTLLTRFTGNEKFVLKNDWRYIDNAAKEAIVSSRDAKFTAEGDGLKTTRYVVITNSPGYPDELPGELMSDIYALQTSSTIKGDLTISIRANEEGELKLVAWNGQEWLTLDSSPDPEDPKTIVATTEDGWLFAVVR